MWQQGGAGPLTFAHAIYERGRSGTMFFYYILAYRTWSLSASRRGTPRSRQTCPSSPHHHPLPQLLGRGSGEGEGGGGLTSAKAEGTSPRWKVSLTHGRPDHILESLLPFNELFLFSFSLPPQKKTNPMTCSSLAFGGANESHWFCRISRGSRELGISLLQAYLEPRREKNSLQSIILFDLCPTAYNIIF